MIESTEELGASSTTYSLDKLHAHFPTGVFGANLAETVPGDIATVNPLVNESLAGSLVIGRILDSLVTLDPVDGTVIPNLAKSWKISEDSLQYTFYLREGVHWSDGHPFTAADVVFTWQTFFAKKQDEITGESMMNTRGRPLYRYNSRSTFAQQINGQEPKVEMIDLHTVRLLRLRSTHLFCFWWRGNITQTFFRMLSRMEY